MACRAKKPLELLPRLGSLRRGARDIQNVLLPATLSTRSNRNRTVSPRSVTSTPAARRSFHTSLSVREKEAKSIASRLQGALSGTTNAYLVYGASEKIYKTCSAEAAYSISEQDRKDGKITLGPDGEDVGISGGGIWHKDFKLLPTFSTWSQVTMLHLYLLIARFRCMEKDVYQNWQAQLVDHFFHEAEEKMDLLHGMTSRSIRQRSLQDLFQQWRGLLLAYDEGVAKGDAVLASAVWRNLFKGKEDVDLRNLAAVVSWMRLMLKNLDKMADDALPLYAGIVFKVPATAELAVVDKPAAATSELFSGLNVKPTAPLVDELDRELPDGLSKPLNI
ncbi:ubiquinol-cytochrome C chaperone-domain-containing protein [Coniochaeta sp. 2T2.1]|nr:ubiquinol-cytochrome C chaperone-domain-containing protein [Coniochaeta sp. 2T2.1]